MAMKKIALLLVATASVLAGLGAVAFAKTHRDKFPVSCNVLWLAVKDAVRESGKYGILGIDDTEMTVSYNTGGTLGGKRTNSVVLNRRGDTTCEMQTQTAFSGLAHNDAGTFKKRVEKSLEEQPRVAEKTVKQFPQQASAANEEKK